MREQRGLYLGRPDPVAGGEDDVVAAALEEEAAVLLADEVAGLPPAAFEPLAVEVVGEEGGGGVGQELQFPLDDPDFDPRQRFAHRALPYRLADQVGRDVPGLGLT